MDQTLGDSVQEKIRWRSWDGSGLEDLVLTYEAECIAMRSTVIAGQLDSGFVAQYAIDASPDWRVIKVEAAVVGIEKPIILYRIDGNQWFDESQTEILWLRGCVDIDLSVTPLTNTFPIRRLQLGVGESAEIEAAYIEFPSLLVSRNLQRYTRLSPLTYRYEAVGTDFEREIVVDQDDLVVTYAGLFRRSQRFRAVHHEPALDPDKEEQTSSST
jgi:hypothetical protein